MCISAEVQAEGKDTEDAIKRIARIAATAVKVANET
jgi:hypothetical protein